MKYYYKESNGVIQYIGKGKRVPKTCVECTAEDYNRYYEITNSIPDKVGYETVLTLYVDFTYTVDYIPVEA